MNIMHSEWKGRIKHWVRTLKDDFYEPLGEIRWEAYRTMEHISPEEASAQTFCPVEPGFVWGETYEYCWMKGTVTLPAEAAGQRIVVDLRVNGETTVFVNGKAFGNYRAAWVSEPHQYIEDNVLTGCAAGGETYELLIEVYAGHYIPEAPTGACATGPVLPGSYTDPLPEGRRRHLDVCTFGIWNEDAYQLYMDVDTLDRLLETLDDTSLRAAKIAKALEKFTLIVDFEQDRDGRIASYREAREAIRPAMEAKNGSTMPVFYAVGNAHLDLAWLWPMAETHRKTARTFAAQLRMIEQYPQYKFIQSQPASYEMCRKYYPELFERIREAIKGGQWIADGAMWVEPDTNMTGGEALIRQLLHGKRYYKEVLGVDSEILWLPDTFGYTAALPQILQKSGVKYLVTQKIFWSYNEGDRFPYHYFNWQGMDGTQVISFLPTSYTYRTDPKEINHVWTHRSQAQDLDAFLLPYGYGDGGGGPARDFVEYALRQEDLEGSAKIKLAGPKEFFDDMNEQGGPVNTYVGELYFSAHRGTYTSQARVKQNNRCCELALREMEMWSSLAMVSGFVYDRERADRLWKELLLHQFHDILPGSSIARVYVEAEKAVEAVIAEAQEMTENAVRFLTEKTGDAVTVFNSLSFEREELVKLPKRFAAGARTLSGEPVCVQETQDGVLAYVAMPACGSVTLVPAANGTAAGGECASRRPEVTLEKTGQGYRMENSAVTALISARGEVTSFILKESGREFAAAPLNRLHLYKDVPRMFDAWDIDSNYTEQEITALTDVKVTPVGCGLEAVLKVEGTIGNSRMVQYIRLAKDSTRLEFDTEIDWKELHRLLKVAFPVDVHAEQGINEIQFGYIERPTHRSKLYDKDRFEVCNHRYSALCDGSHGAAVLNDCKYGLSMNGNALELTLLRAPASPELRADNRVHHFTYAFTAWEGSFAASDVVRQGYELNVKPLVAEGTAKSLMPAKAVQIEKENIFLDTLKPAEDGSGDLILRLYEAKKCAGKTDIFLGFPCRQAYECDMLEHKEKELSAADGKLELDFGAFEIKTIRIEG